jgi:hypothetical protein
MAGGYALGIKFLYFAYVIELLTDWFKAGLPISLNTLGKGIR